MPLEPLGLRSLPLDADDEGKGEGALDGEGDNEVTAKKYRKCKVIITV